jgi:hypothetical protein
MSTDVSLMMEAVRTSETSVDNHFTRQYIPEDNSEQDILVIHTALKLLELLNSVKHFHRNTVLKFNSIHRNIADNVYWLTLYLGILPVL